MAAGGKHKYLLYVASADALANRRRRGENFLHVVCLSEEGDHLSMWLTSLIKAMNSTGAGSTSSL